MNSWVAAWVTWLEHEQDLEPSTRRLYERTIQALDRDLPDGPPLEKLETKDLLTWLQRKSGSPGSYANRVSALRSFYGYLSKERGFLSDPSASLDLPKRAPSTREPVREIRSKLRLLDELDERVGRRVGESRDMAWFLAQTGLRISDACKLSLKRPVPAQLVISYRRRPDRVVKLNAEAQDALNRLGGRFGIGPRALQRRFEKAGFHPDQLRHWYRVNVADVELRDADTEGGSIPIDAPVRETSPAEEQISSDRAKSVGSGEQMVDPLTAVGRFLRLAEDVTSVLVREARRQGRSWEEIASALSIPEAAIKERFAA